MNTIELVRLENVLIESDEEQTIYIRLSEIEYAYKNSDNKIVLAMRSGTKLILNGTGMFEGFPTELSSIYALSYLVSEKNI